MDLERFTLQVLVANRFGVLTRVTGLFSKRGFNIDSLHAVPIEGTERSRVTLTTRGDHNTREQMVKQLQKLHDVERVELLQEHTFNI